MGFRFPLTTASEIDTRVTPGGAGVRVYQDNSQLNFPKGIIEFTDGLNGDTGPAQVLQHAQGSQTAQNRGDAGGLSLIGGTYFAGAAPTLDLKVNSVNAGINPGQGSARLTGGPLDVDRPITSSDAAQQWTDFPFIAGAWQAFNAGADKPRYRRDAAGECHLAGLVQIVTGSGFAIGAGANGQVGTLPSGYFQTVANIRRPVGIFSSGGVQTGITVATVSTAGVLTIYNNTGATLGAGVAFDLGMTIPTA